MSSIGNILSLISLVLLLLDYGNCQALNSHINPAWVESGRELLARQGLRSGLQDYNQRVQGTRQGATGYNQGYQTYSPRQPSLFYLDDLGQLRPVLLNSAGPTAFPQLNNYRSQFGSRGLSNQEQLYPSEVYIK